MRRALILLLFAIPAFASKKVAQADYQDAVLVGVSSVPDGSCTITDGTGTCTGNSIRVYRVTVGAQAVSIEHVGWHVSPLYRMLPGTHFPARIDMPHVYVLENGKEVRFLIVSSADK